MAVSIKMNRVRPQLIVNSDQTGLLLGGGQKKTYEEKGAKEVPINGHGDKRQITVVLGVSFEPDILPLQLVYEGKTEKVLPHCTLRDWMESQ